MDQFGIARKTNKSGESYEQIRSWCKSCAREYQRNWIKKNPEKLATYQKQDRQRHPDRYKQQVERYREVHGHPEHNRKALLAGVPRQEISKTAVLRRSDGKCGICNTDVDPDNFHVDHIVPLSKGGHHMYYNVQAAHPKCNLKKSDKYTSESCEEFSVLEGCGQN